MNEPLYLKAGFTYYTATVPAELGLWGSKQREKRKFLSKNFD